MTPSPASTDDAVSPVIGVILMVAITVVLAAVVFVLVSNLSDADAQVPQMGITRDERNDQVKIIRADLGLNWQDFKINSDADIFFDLNAQATTADVEVDAGTQVAFTDDVAVSGGNYISLCGDGLARTNVAIKIIHTDSNTVVASTTFASIADCAA